MPNAKGISLMEIIVAIVILGVLAAIAVPNYYTSMQQSAAQAAENNLISIYSAQKAFYLKNGSYCTTNCSTTDQINTQLSSNIVDNNFSYTCYLPSNFCLAVNNTDNSFIISINLKNSLVSK